MTRSLITVSLVGIGLLGVDARTTPDSFHYIGAAETLPWGFPSDYFNWGPFYPVLLASFGTQALWLNAALLVALVGAVSWLFWTSGFRAWLIAVSVSALSQPIQYVYSFVWSEGPFLVFTLLFLIAWSSYLDQKRPTMLCIASLLLGAALLTRHIGVVLFAVCFLTVLQDDRDWKTRCKSLFAVSIGPVLVYGGWLTRNVMMFGSPTPERPEPSLSDFTATLDNAANILGHWAVPHLSPGAVLTAIAIAIVGLVASQLRRFDNPYAWVFAHFVVTYLIALVVLTSVLTISTIQWRFLAPVFVPTLVVVVFFGYRVYHAGSKWTKKATEYLVLIWCLSWITAPNALNEAILNMVT